MSSITPASFVDDGGSFQKRIPRGLHPAHVSRWLDTAESDTTSAYTGSYIDDGADMLLPSRDSPGFGKIDPRFYKQRKPRADENNAAWNEDIQKAVAGDISRSLEKMRHVGRVEVKRADESGRPRDEKNKTKKKDTITIPMPPKWGTFVIKADDGRVIVVDEHGEFDSGPQQPEKKEDVGTKWVKAPTTISLPSSPPSTASLGKHKNKKNRIPEPLKPLTPIPESESEYEDQDDGYQPSGGEYLLSPTGFFMTGGANGWPADRSGSVASPVRKSSRHSYTDSLVVTKKPSSPVRSPPGSWPQSPTKEANGSVTVTSESSGSAKGSSRSGSRRSRRSKKSKNSSQRGADNVSVKSYSTYRPATVEDAPDTSSENASLAKNGNAWGGSHKSGENNLGGSKKGSEASWNDNNGSVTNSSSSHKTANTGPPAIQNWISDRVKTVSDTSSHRSRSRRTSRAPSEHTWDGYELPKTLSEVSVAGTESERSSLGSHGQSGRPSRRSRAPGHEQVNQGGWDGSQAGWGGSQGANVDGWGGERTESGSSNGDWSQGGYKNGYDEDNETYLNDNWSGVRVRVRSRSRRGSVSGWGG